MQLLTFVPPPAEPPRSLLCLTLGPSPRHVQYIVLSRIIAKIFYLNRFPLSSRVMVVCEGDVYQIVTDNKSLTEGSNLLINAPFDFFLLTPHLYSGGRKECL